MPAAPLAVVAEDKLTEAVLHKCIAVTLSEHVIVRSEVKGGRGNVQRELPAYFRLAQGMPVILGVDLDSDECAPNLLESWFDGAMRPQRALVRVAVREIETWVMADRKRLAAFLGAPSDDIRKNLEARADPKLDLLRLANRYAGQELRRDLVPRNFGRYPRIGPAYNLRMCEFVATRWRPRVAAASSDSLARAIRAIESLRED